jgi:2,3-bisphosphoglycerate-independent phosphoglycerate mutase
MNTVTSEFKITPVLLLILDGFGHRLEGNDNAILLANTPNWDKLNKTYASGTINASEQFVGLPAGQFGNSEVGHLNIGAGRVVQQDISRIDDDVAHDRLKDNPVLHAAIHAAINGQCALHILGLISDGGVHSHEKHIHALIAMAAKAGVQKICIHAFLDGRDTPPKSAELYLQRLEAVCTQYPVAYIASVCGRYYAMDRDQRWERIEPAYQLVVDGQSQFTAPSALQALHDAYARGENDEFVQATAILHNHRPTMMQDGDVVVCMNFRADRIRQFITALTDLTFNAFSARQPKLSYICTLTRYSENFSFPVAYIKLQVYNSFGEYLSKLNCTQLRIAETEKYPHVTYFFNGGRETPFPKEERILVPSPKVPTYDMQPEMSANEVTDKLVEAIASRRYDAIICNYANGDMVGHTGKLDAAIKAVETLDGCIQRCVEAMQAIGGEVLIIADHGNCEMMWDNRAQQPHTQHTTDEVPFLYIGRPAVIEAEGALKDVAPSLLQMMGLPKPEEMTGHSLIHFTG